MPAPSPPHAEVHFACAHSICRPLVDESDTVTGTTAQATGNSDGSERGGGGGAGRRKERGSKGGAPSTEGLLSS